MNSDENGRGEVFDVTAESGTERLHLPPKKRFLLIAGVSCAAVVIAAAVIAVFALRAAVRRPVKIFFEAVRTADGAAFVEALPPCVTDSMAAGDIDPAAYFEDNMLRDTLTELEEDYGERVRISFDEEQRFELDTAEISSLQDKLRESYGDIEIDKACDLQISYTVKGSHKSETKSREFTVCKTGGRWYIAGVPNTII